MKLAFGNVVSKEFRDRLFEIVHGFGWSDSQASDLMACIAFETGGTFSPSIRNAAGSGATGMLQFMPATAEGLGTTTDALAAMTAVAQLDYVAKYFKPYAKRIKSLSDMYMAILLPKAVGMPEDFRLFSGGTAYRQNAGLDANNDGLITKAEATGRVQATLWKGMQPPNVFEVQPKGKPVDPIATTILTTALPKLFSALPDLVSIFKQPDVATRNAEALAKVGDIIMTSTQATNMQDAVTRVTADPQTAAEANNAIRLSRADIMDIVERTAAIDEKSVADARTFSEQDPPILGKWKFIHIISLLLIILGGAASGYILITSKDATERAMALQTLLLVGFAGTAAFWIGSSRSSQVKDMMRAK